MIPRGGAASKISNGVRSTDPLLVSHDEDGGSLKTAADDHAAVITEERSKKKGKSYTNHASGWLRGGFKNLPDKTGWIISLILSVVYAYLFSTTAGTNQEQCTGFQRDGFCVTNLHECLMGTKGVGNSHIWAFAEDVVFTFLTLALPSLLGIKPEDLVGGKWNWIGSAIIISIHGALHGYIASKDCSPPTGGIGNDYYFIFTAFLSWFIVNNFGALDSSILNIVIALISAVFTLYLTNTAGSGVAPIFLITQLLASLTAVCFPNPDTLTPTAGYAFIAPCLVSIIELMYCCDGEESPSIFNTSGGHAW